ncbi:MAG: alpha/beta hydrolase family protein [Prolixibacteraceae bacterium]
MRFFVSLFILVFWCTSLWAARVQTVKTFSKSMNKEIDAVVITPDSYSGRQAVPVLYLLHGYSDKHDGWITKVPAIGDLADLYHFIIVCPDGNFSSWYLDSPVDPQWKYETYTARELPQWIDENFKTIRSREGRAITGLSMGGHGAFYLAFRNQDVFGAAGSMSGGVDIRPFPKNWDLSKRLGTYAENTDNWEKNSVINLIHLLTPGSLEISFECGTGDFFYLVNCNLHEKLLERNIPHDFAVRPGAHNWEYWANAITYQALFFHRFFNKKASVD